MRLVYKKNANDRLLALLSRAQEEKRTVDYVVLSTPEYMELRNMGVVLPPQGDPEAEYVWVSRPGSASEKVRFRLRHEGCYGVPYVVADEGFADSEE